MIDTETGKVYYEVVLDIECPCGHIGIHPNYHAYVNIMRGVGCYLCGIKQHIFVRASLAVGETITWNHNTGYPPNPDLLKIRIKRLY